MFGYWPSFYEARRTQGKNKANIDPAAILIEPNIKGRLLEGMQRLMMEIYSRLLMVCYAIRWKRNSAVSGLFNLAIGDNPNRQLAFIAAPFRDIRLPFPPSSPSFFLEEK